MFAWVVVLALVTGLNAFAQDTGNGGGTQSEPGTVDTGGTLVVQKDTANEFDAAFGVGGALITIDSDQVEETPQGDVVQSPGDTSTPDKIVTSLEVNGKQVDVTKDLQEETVSLDGNGNALQAQDKNALVALEGELVQEFSPAVEAQQQAAAEESPTAASAPDPRHEVENPLQPQEQLLLSTVTFLSEAPVGQPVKEVEAPEPETESSPREAPVGETPSSVSAPTGQASTEETSSMPVFFDRSYPSTITLGYNPLIDMAAKETSEKQCAQAEESNDFRFLSSYCIRGDQDYYWNSYYGVWQPY